VTTSLARRLVQPDFLTGPAYIETYGPAVGELCGKAGFEPDPQQQLCLDHIFGIRNDGLSASFSFCVICCRQNLKTGLLKQAVIGWLFVTEQPLVVWSAHEMSTTRDALLDLSNLITEAPSLSKYLPVGGNRGIYDANGQERIELQSGQRVKFKARTRDGGRGLTAPKVVLDEAFALTAAQLGALLPTMTAMPDPQVLYASSAGKATSMALRDVRDRGRAGSTPRLTYVEWLAPKQDCKARDCEHPKGRDDPGYAGCALNDVSLRIKANPTITTGRINLETLDGLRDELPPEEFARECLGWWDDAAVGGGDFFKEGAWQSGAVRVGQSELGRDLALAIAVSVDRKTASICAGGRNAEGRMHYEPIVTGLSMGQVVAEAKRLQEEHSPITTAIDGGGPGADLIQRLEDAGVILTVMKTEDVKSAAAEIVDIVEGGDHAHLDDPELNAAVSVAIRRNIGDRFGIGRRKLAGDVDVTPFEGVCFAGWAANNVDEGFNIY
jgi:hypothetical protein